MDLTINLKDIFTQKESIEYYLNNHYWLNKDYLTELIKGLKLLIENYIWLRDLKI